MSSAAGDIIVGSAHGKSSTKQKKKNMISDSSDGCLMASTKHGTIDVYVSQAGKVHLKSDKGKYYLHTVKCTF
ncbi:unnamed protein product [Staurois parvus]|uniref:Uncharacterized protein n=1 Tax=Staurois parvus TaxID=386267 RepID=A0ABN9HSL5_9NEOB|nr:unnamed protein product [Staurois parvus]